MTSKSKDKSAAETVESMASAGKETFETLLAKSAQAQAEGCKTALNFAKDQLETGKSGYDKLVAFGKGNLEAYSAASTAALGGVEVYYDEVVDGAKKAVAGNIELMQKLAAVKTPHEMLDLQLQAVNGLVNGSLAQSAKLNKIAAATLAKVVEPLKARFDGNVEALVKPFFG